MLLHIYWLMSIVFIMGITVSKGLEFQYFLKKKGQFGFPNSKDKTLYSLDLASYC